MSDFLSKALLLLIGAAATGIVAGIGFLIKRRVSHEDPVEKFIANHQRLLAVNSSSTQPFLEADRAKLRQVIRELHPGVAFQENLYTTDPGISQAEIGQRAADAAEREMLEVRHLVERLRARLKANDEAALQGAQSVWERYVNLQARLAAEPFAGGTIMPSIYQSERAALARTRAADLRRILDSYDL